MTAIAKTTQIPLGEGGTPTANDLVIHLRGSWYFGLPRSAKGVPEAPRTFVPLMAPPAPNLEAPPAEPDASGGRVPVNYEDLGPDPEYPEGVNLDDSFHSIHSLPVTPGRDWGNDDDKDAATEIVASTPRPEVDEDILMATALVSTPSTLPETNIPDMAPLSLHGPKYGTVQLSTTHKVRSLTDPTEGVANSYSHLNRPIMYVPIRYLRHCNL